MENLITEEIIISAFQYLTWPILILILAIMFKKQLKGIRKIKIKDYEIELKNEIDEISKDIGVKSGDWKVTSTKFLKENMLELSKKSPVAVVLQAWDILENMIFEEAKLFGDYDNYTVGAILQDMYEKKYIEKEKLNIYFRIYALKNRMSYFENEKVTQARALEFSDVILSIGNSIVETLKGKKET